MPVQQSPFRYREKPVYEAVNRVINVAVALMTLVALGPLMLAIALLIKLSDPRAGVLYRGRRIGRGGRTFSILKFRTMVPGTEQRLGARLVHGNSPAITPLGRHLRRRKLDELPQLLNVLHGSMNLVGPRPARDVFLAELRQRIPGYERRFLVNPGITGLAQIRGGYYIDPRDKLRYELLYIRHRSVLLDLKLIAATLLILARRMVTTLGVLVFLLTFAMFVPTAFMPRLSRALAGGVNPVFLLIGFVAVVWLIRNVFHRGLAFRRTPADKYIGAFVLWAILGAFLNPGVWRNLLGVLYFCAGAFALYFLATQAISRDVARIRRHVAVLGLVTVVVSLGGIGQYLVGYGIDGFRVASSLGDPNVLALYLTMAVPLLLYLRSSSVKGASRLFWGAGIVVGATCLILTFSRSGYIAFAIALTVFMARHRRALLTMLAGWLVLVLAFQLAGAPRFSSRQIAASSQAQQMIRLYASVLDGPRDTRLLGVGWRNWRAALDTESSVNDEIRLGIVSLPRSLKNMYLTFLVEHGLVGLLFMLLTFVTILQALYRGSRAVTDPLVQPLLWAIFSGALGFLMNLLFFDSFYFVAVQMTFWSLVGFGMGIALEFGPSSRGRYRVQEFHH